MQTIWSRSPRPQSICRCISCTNPLPRTLSRRTTTGIVRKRLTAGDAFSLLLGPVLGGALIADTRAKDKRRREWDEKIAAVQAEVEQMGRNEVKTYSIRTRNLRRLPPLRRNYSSAAGNGLVVADEDETIMAVDWLSTHESYRHAGEPASTAIVHNHAAESGQELAEPQSKPELDQATIEKCKRLQRLVAIKLAIRMILHIHIGKSPRYINTGSDYVYEEGGLPQNANELIRHLKQVRNSLKLMNTDDLRFSWKAYQGLTRGKQCSLDQEMCDLARWFKQGEMNVTQLVEQFASRLLSSSESPTVSGYVPFLSVLSRARFDELGFMVDGTMIEARLPYDRHAVFTLLWQYGKNKEAHYFDKLLKKLTTDSAKYQFGERWVWRDKNGILVPIPPSKDPQILQILIYTALKCNQPHRAEAWSKILAHARTGNMWLSHVIRNFLKYYSAHKNWQKSQAWMKTALDKAEMLAAQGIRHLQRIAFSMLDCSVAYEERALYRDILQAAVDCRLGVYSADPNLTLTQRSTDILTEWKSRHETAHCEEIDALPSIEKARIFTSKLHHIQKPKPKKIANRIRVRHCIDGKEQVQMRSLRGKYAESLVEFKADDSIDPQRTPPGSDNDRDGAGAGKWKELCRQQQSELDSLKRQLDSVKRQLESLKSKQKPDSTLTKTELDSAPIGAVINVTQSPTGTTFGGVAPQYIREN